MIIFISKPQRGQIEPNKAVAQPRKEPAFKEK